jgi:hypothetical protein
MFFSVGDLLNVNLNSSSLYTLNPIEIEYLFFLNCFLEKFYKVGWVEERNPTFTTFVRFPQGFAQPIRILIQTVK